MTYKDKGSYEFSPPCTPLLNSYKGVRGGFTLNPQTSTLNPLHRIARCKYKALEFGVPKP